MTNQSVIDELSRIKDADDLGLDVSSDIPSALFTYPDVIPVIRIFRGNARFLLEAIPFQEWLRAVNNCQHVWIDLLGKKEGNVNAIIYINDRLNEARLNFPALRCSLEWLEYISIGRVSQTVIDIARFQSYGNQSIIEKMWSGFDSLIQTHLLRKHNGDEIWPSSPFFHRAWTVFADGGLPEVIRILMDISETPGGLFWGHRSDHRYQVANLPVLPAAYRCRRTSTGVRPEVVRYGVSARGDVGDRPGRTVHPR